MDGVRIEPGGVSDLAALEPHAGHYRAGRPAVIDRVLAARCARTGAPVGVLVTARPVLNGPWRHVAWPGWLDGLSPRGRAEMINAHLRTIARVVVHPAWRARGVGSGLVRAYLAAPATARTEALAAMADHCPLFERAGMRPVGWPLSRARAGLVRALRSAGARVWMLSDPAARGALASDPRVAAAVGVLAAERLRAGTHLPARRQLDALWPLVASPPRAFVHGPVAAPRTEIDTLDTEARS